MKTTFTLLVTLFFVNPALFAKDTLWKITRPGGYELMIVKSSPRVRWGGEGVEEIYLNYKTPGFLSSRHPYMGMIAGIIEEGIAMQARGSVVEMALGPRVTFNKNGSIELFFESEDPRTEHTFVLSRDEALDFIKVIRKYYNELIEID